MRQPNEYDVIREVVYRKTPHVWVGNARHECSCSGILLEMQERLPDFSVEPGRYLTVPFPVPGRCLA